MPRSKKLTIVCVAADLIPNQLGGAEAHVVEVIKRLSKKHKIILFVGADTSIKKLFPKNVSVLPIRYPKIANLYGISHIVFGFFQSTSALRNVNFDLIWAKQVFPQAPLAVLLKKVFNKPVYVTAQNPKLHQEELVIKGSLLKPFHKLFSYLLTPLIFYSLRQADLVACVSNYSKKLAKDTGAKKVAVIPNGVNLLPQTRPKKAAKKALKLITTSALIPRNGIDILIDSVSLLPDAINWQLSIAGDGPEHTALKSQTTRLGLDTKINFLGRVLNNKIQALLRSSDIFIRPSRHEGFGVSFIEAMAAGIPVIATSVGGIPDFIKHKQTGLLAKVESPQSVAKNISLLDKDKKLYKKLQTNALKLVKENYTWDKIAKSVEDHFLELTS